MNNQNDQDEDVVPPSILKSMTSVSKNSFLRDLVGLKTLMDKRAEQRSLTLYYLTTKKYQSALIYCRQLAFSSMKIYKQFYDDYADEFEENFFIRISKAKLHVEYLLDCIIACRVFIQAKKKQDAIDILEKVEMLDDKKQKNIKMITARDKIRMNDQHQIVSKMCAALLTFIQIAKSEKLNEYCQKFYNLYVNFVKDNYGAMQYSTALFKYGLYLYEAKRYELSEETYKLCIQIRKKNVINSCLVDCYVNLSICQRELSKYNEAIVNIKQSIQIYKDIKISDEGIDHFYLFLGKLHIQNAEFNEAFENLLKCYKLRQKLDNEHPGKIQIQLNMMIFVKILKDVTEKYRDMLTIEDKHVLEQKRREAINIYNKVKNMVLDRQQFSKYRDFKSSKFNHLNLFISKEFFQSLSAAQLFELEVLMKKLGDMTFARGLVELQKCSFYEEKRLRDMLVESNGHLKKGASKKTSSQIGSSKFI